MKKRLLLFASAIAALAGCAQSRVPIDPAALDSKVPPLEYRSAFAGYAALTDEEITPWRDANDSVKSAGGHGDHPEPAADGRPAQRAAKPVPGQEHRGHQ